MIAQLRAIFISYRREDAEGQAGRLFDDLVKHCRTDVAYAAAYGAHGRRVTTASGLAPAQFLAGQRPGSKPRGFTRRRSRKKAYPSGSGTAHIW